MALGQRDRTLVIFRTHLSCKTLKQNHISYNVKTEGLASSHPSADPFLLMKKTALPEVLAWLPDTRLKSL